VEVGQLAEASLTLAAAGLGPVTAARPDFVFEVACPPFEALREWVL
jgi:ATP phosphoribosyltransferase